MFRPDEGGGGGGVHISHTAADHPTDHVLITSTMEMQLHAHSLSCPSYMPAQFTPQFTRLPSLWICLHACILKPTCMVWGGVHGTPSCAAGHYDRRVTFYLRSMIYFTLSCKNFFTSVVFSILSLTMCSQYCLFMGRGGGGGGGGGVKTMLLWLHKSIFKLIFNDVDPYSNKQW